MLIPHTSFFMNRFFLSIFFFAVLSYAHVTDSLFVPPKPEKPLRYCTSAKKWMDYATHDSNLVEITYMRGIRMDLRYASFNNVTGHDMYCGIQRAFVHKDALPKLRRALSIISKELPGYSLVMLRARCTHKLF